MIARGWLVLQRQFAFRVGLVTALGSLPTVVHPVRRVIADRVTSGGHSRTSVSHAGRDSRPGGVDRTHLITVQWVWFWPWSRVLLAPSRSHPAIFSGRESWTAGFDEPIALNSSAFNLARVVGPASRRLIATVGMAAVSRRRGNYLAVIISLARMDPGVSPRCRPSRSRRNEARLLLRFVNRWPRALVTLIATSPLWLSRFCPHAVFARDCLRVGASGMRPRVRNRIGQQALRSSWLVQSSGAPLPAGAGLIAPIGSYYWLRRSRRSSGPR